MLNPPNKPSWLKEAEKGVLETPLGMGVECVLEWGPEASFPFSTTPLLSAPATPAKCFL